MIDILIKNCRIVDGTGNAAYHADIAVQGDRIVKIGHLGDMEAAKIIDAAGKYVTPGFIDAHSHSDHTLADNPLAQSTIRQGITAEIVGHCGMGIAPRTLESMAKGAGILGSYKERNVIVGSFSKIIEQLYGNGVSENTGWFIPHTNLRLLVDAKGPRATDEQLKIMKEALREAMQGGALGLSTGIEFPPGRTTDPEEIDELLSVVKEFDGVYSSHIRNRDEFIEDAVEEYLTALRKAGVRGSISHFNVRHNTNVPPMGWEHALEKMEKAREEGLDVLGEMTPFPWGIGIAQTLLPPWIMENGPAAAAKQLEDPQIRKRLRTDCDRYWRFIHKGEWDRVGIQSNVPFPELNGLSMKEAAARLGMDEWDCFFEILSKSGELMSGNCLKARLYSDEHMLQKIAQPQFMLTVDGYSADLSNKELTDSLGFCLHYMGMIHFLIAYVRDMKVLSIEECVRRMTGLTASHYRLKGRGMIQEGAFADINIFDLDNLKENSTLDDPYHYASGFDYVIVNGVPVLDETEHTGARPGVLLRAAF
ncbi:MAG: amidohydrolase family protein [Clostridia bacterium]|nr:amidohydrolase family protein [Clostridia bacterium]